jgi:peptidoglycan/xylan/chitin deacetylase (PgdA/CDA1 family)
MIALNFHGIGEPHAAVPADERPYWLSVESFRGIIERIVREYDPEDFAFTFDDGNKSDLLAADMLARFGLRGRFFLLTGRFDRPNSCSREDARQLLALGMIVGLHGRDHRDWKSLDAADLEDETVTARTELAEVIGAPVEDVAIPFGSYDSRVMKWLKQQGFTRIHTSDRGKCDPSSSVWNRNTLRSDMGEAELAAILSGHEPVSQRIRRPIVRYLKRNLV